MWKYEKPPSLSRAALEAKKKMHKPGTPGPTQTSSLEPQDPHRPLAARQQEHHFLFFWL